jgi:hypothetical protein
VVWEERRAAVGDEAGAVVMLRSSCGEEFATTPPEEEEDGDGISSKRPARCSAQGENSRSGTPKRVPDTCCVTT